MMDTSEVARLIRKKLDGKITAQELLLLENWAEQDPSHAGLLAKVDSEELVFEDVLGWLALRNGEEKGAWNKRLETRTLYKISESRPKPVHRMPTFRRLFPYAAVLLAIATFTLIFYRSYVAGEHPTVVQDLTPGTNKALLTLSNSSVIELREDQEGVVLGTGLTYEDGTLIAQLDEENVVYATIETPRGGQYQITLADGTKVWLNAASKLTYPSHFIGGSREVELVGEAYFEVAPFAVESEKIPFLVKTAQQEIEVLGTQFNIKAYAEDNVRTTLVEGAVQLHASGKTLLLEPGEQGVSDGQALNKKKVDVDQYIAWKNNEFLFEETELKDALKMLSRWYDFDVNIESNFPTTHLYGSISREKKLTEVLKIMESSGLKFRIERSGNRNILIYYMNN